MIGIYKIENIITHQCYIGQSKHIERRWKEHCQPSNTSLISKAIQKYGKENFTFQILLECSIDELNEQEARYIEKYNSLVPYGYNVCENNTNSITSYTFFDKQTIDNIKFDLKNTCLTIQEIADKYNIHTRSIYRINRGQVHYDTNETYPLRIEIAHLGNYCIDCGQKISSGSQRCLKCASLTQRHVERPTREELKAEIRHMSFTALGKKYNVTDNAIRKWCEAYNLPKRKADIKTYTDEEWALI